MQLSTQLNYKRVCILIFFSTDFNSKYFFLFQFIQIEQNANKFYANSNLWLPNCLPMTRVIFLLCSAMSYLKQARPCIQKKKRKHTQKKAQQVHTLLEIAFKLCFHTPFLSSPSACLRSGASRNPDYRSSPASYLF